jgi:FkbM family methyltransferase
MYDRKLLFLRAALRIAFWRVLSGLKVEGFHRVPGFPFAMYLEPSFRSVGSLALYALGSRYELALHHLPKLLRRGDVVFDCGASQGGYALYAAHLVGPSGTVVAVEPQPYAARAIRISAAANGFEQLRVEEAAVADEDGVLPFFINGKEVSGSLVDYGVSESRNVPARSLDSLTREYGLHRLDMIKLDVEGAEHWALAGARESIARFRPMVVFECWETEDANYQRAWDTLKSWGYRIFDMIAQDRVAELDGVERSYNLLAVPPEKVDRLEGFTGAPVIGWEEPAAASAA